VLRLHEQVEGWCAGGQKTDRGTRLFCSLRHGEIGECNMKLTTASHLTCSRLSALPIQLSSAASMHDCLGNAVDSPQCTILAALSTTPDIKLAISRFRITYRIRDHGSEVRVFDHPTNFLGARSVEHNHRCRPGVPGKFCTRENETNWYGRGPRWDEERNIRLSRS
jgi:hypothetical protein